MAPGAPILIDTPHGPARAHIERVPGAEGTLFLGHGAGGGVDSPDLVAAAQAAAGAGFGVVRIEQPYRVAGRRAPAPAGQLDAAWLTIVRHLAPELPGELLLVGGRSAGARVACRTASDLSAAGVLCLAFPLHPPGKAGDPTKSRLAELEAVQVPVLVVQGERDPFGRPPPGPDRRVVVVAGSHTLRSADEVDRAVADWIGRFRP